MPTTSRIWSATNAGKEAAWNQILKLIDYDPQNHDKLYVDIVAEESMTDDPIAFTTIPLHQVIAATGHVICGRFDLYTVGGKQKGEIVLTIAVVAPGQTEAHHASSEIMGTSELNSEHQTHVIYLCRREHTNDAALAAGAVGALTGAVIAKGGVKGYNREY
ncbi:hypothetical protein BGZ96_009158 [Linnemannia gamsii]|uniref:Uncharacterized protein n=1 Tax=Linnemannia gamsii TaxID=64522 RepID=A0ABQ7JXQ2_9FUNG|nr:hypothetical protein BGZ96_009158 [Linnemannia gamsii]